jgi:hypothetical protein
MTELRGDGSRRRKAKCTYCEQVFNHGKPHLLFSHIKDSCVAVSPEKKSAYLRDVVAAGGDEISLPSDNGCDDGRIISVSIPSKKKSNPSVDQFFRPVSNEKTQHLHELLFKSLISSNIPLTYLENPYFQEYQSELARSVYKIPRRVQMMEKVLPMIHAKSELSMYNILKDQNCLTLSLDGWTDNSGNSIYALMILKGSTKKYFLDVLDLHSERHTAENIFLAVKDSLKSKQIGLDKICALVTDSPSVMIKLRVSNSVYFTRYFFSDFCFWNVQRILNQENPHVLKIHCTLHVFNLIAKRIANHPDMGSVIKGNKTLVNYFTTSTFWHEHLSTWRKTNGVKHGLETLCETRWYSMAKVCLGVQSHELGFQKCLDLLLDPLVDTPSMSDAVIQVIKDRDHFTANQSLVRLLKPVIDAIGNLERADTTLSDIWKELLNVYKSIRDVEVYSRFELFKSHCLNVIQSQTKVFHEEIYVIAFFLHPAYRRVAVSKKHSLSDVGQMILRLAKSWKLTKSEASCLQDATNRYYNSLFPFDSKAIDKPLNFWLTLPHTPETSSLKKLAIGILEIVPHAAGVEGLFSMMSAIKTKARNRMSPTTLKMIAQIKLQILQSNPLLAPRKKRTQNESQKDSEYENMRTYDAFLTPTELEEFETGIFTEDQMRVVAAREDAFMDTIFDFDMWENPPPQPNEVIVIDNIEDIANEESNWDPQELWLS